MSGFFGGRAEARIVRTVAPVVPVDATAMYSLVNALLGTWGLLIARDIREIDVTAAVRALLRREDLFTRCFDRRFWRDAIGVTLVELEDVAGSILPVRAPYDPLALDPGIGVNPLFYEGRLWYLLPDAVASIVLCGLIPRVRRAIRLRGVGRQSGLREVPLRGGRRIDPAHEDLFVAMVNERQRVHQDRSLPPEQRERVERFLKVTGSATTYGVQARFDRRELAESLDLLIYGPDNAPLRRSMRVVEDPGPYSFPPIAASITAGARLMLALLEQLLSDAGSTYLYCDTDAMGLLATPEGGNLVCPTEDGADRIRVLSFDEVRTILARFRDLNPFDPKLVTTIWRIEHDAMARPLLGYTISAKRYALFRTSEPASPELVAFGEERATEADGAEPEESEELTDWSEHGLGLYQSPLIAGRGEPLRDERGRPVWMREAWNYVLGRAMGGNSPLPAWAGAFALTRFSLSSPAVAGWFSRRDERVGPTERMRPGSFGLIAHPFLANGALPVAAFDSDPTRWPNLEWSDRTGEPIRVMSFDPSMGPDRLADLLSFGYVPIKTLGEVLTAYMTRPEHKSLAPDGSSANGTSTGLLRRRPVRSSLRLTHLAGKEGNKLLQRATSQVSEPAQYRSDYGSRVDWWELVGPVLREMGTKLVAQVSGKHERTARRAITLTKAPASSRSREWMSAVAIEYARTQLRASSARLPSHPVGVLERHAAENETRRGHQCACGCDRTTDGRSKWASEACRKRAARRTSSV